MTNKTLFLTSLTILTLTAFSDLARAQSQPYTRYELLGPDSAQFRILYDVTATRAGDRFYFNPIREGSEASDEHAYDVMTGAELKLEVVSGSEARESGLRRANPQGHYIKVHLARPVPEGGAGRIRIEKTYKDAKSYFRDGDLIIFSRSLGIKRNSVVLPVGYELIGCNYPSQIATESDGRIRVSFLNAGPDAVSYVVKARPLPKSVSLVSSDVAASEREVAGRIQRQTATQAPPRVRTSFPERAHQDREIVYFLNPPETHSFRLYHDYTETREGVDKYVNVVRGGSSVSNPSAKILDTGQTLRTEMLKGEAIRRAGVRTGGEITPETQVVVIHFDPVKKGQSVRLRIEETYTDAGRYGIVEGEMLWHRSFGRPRNAVLLPEGWYVTANSIPATVSQSRDGRIRLNYVNPRPDNIDVILKAKHR